MEPELVDGLNFPIPLDHSSTSSFVGKLANIVPIVLKLLSVDEILGFFSVEGKYGMSKDVVNSLGCLGVSSKVTVE